MCGNRVRRAARILVTRSAKSTARPPSPGRRLFLSARNPRGHGGIPAMAPSPALPTSWGREVKREADSEIPRGVFVARHVHGALSGALPQLVGEGRGGGHPALAR